MAALHAVRSALRDAVRAGLAPVERLALRLGDTLPYAPIFIVSPPRSGSTLLYTLAVPKYRPSYFYHFERSEDRRGGKAGVSTCRSLCSEYHSTKTKQSKKIHKH